MIACHIVRDLLPNHIENLTSEETGRDIAEHLEGCEACRSALEQLRKPIPDISAPDTKINFLKKINRAMKIRLLAVLGVLVLLAAVFSQVFLVGARVHSGDVLIRIEKTKQEYGADLGVGDIDIYHITLTLVKSGRALHVAYSSANEEFGVYDRLYTFTPRAVVPLFDSNVEYRLYFPVVRDDTHEYRITVRLSDTDIVFVRQGDLFVELRREF